MSSSVEGSETVTKAAAGRVNAVVPYAILRALQMLDRTDAVDLEEYAEEVAPRRLGISATVSAEIERYGRLVKNGKTVTNEEAAQLFQLVQRRNDAELAFSTAGRLAAEEIVMRTSATTRIVHRAGQVVARQRLGNARAIRLAARLLGVKLTFEPEVGPVAVAEKDYSLLDPDGRWCGFFAAALAELLRQCTDFQGALAHTSCRSRGDLACKWQSGSVGR